MPLTDAERRKISNDLQRISGVVERELQRAAGRKGIGFSLVVWGAFGEDQMIQYVSNVAREDALRHMLELCRSWIKGMPDIPFHERQ